MGSLRRVFVIALSESKRTRGSFDKRSLVVFAVVAIAVAIAAPLITERGFDFDHGLYRVAVQNNAQAEEAVARNAQLRLVESDNPLAALAQGEVDAIVARDQIVAANSDKGRAAAAALVTAAKIYTQEVMLEEPDRAAAFPILVSVRYEQIERDRSGGPQTATPTTPTPGDGSARPDFGDLASGPPPGVGGTGFDLIPQSSVEGTPASLQPPFPFRSLILAYVFLIPMNFVAQVYGGSVIGERIARRGESLLASPASAWEIIVGKALPYIVSTMAMGALIAFGIGGGWLSVVAILPVALAFLAFEFAAGMFARSFRELTFLTVLGSVLITIYCFLPAVFANVHPVALVSPITLVVFDLRGDPVALADILYSLLPLTFCSAVAYFLAAGLYREEDLFHQKRVGRKALDAIARRVRGPWHAFGVAALTIPFVFAAELLLVSVLFAWSAPTGVLGVLILVALVEETFKAAPSYAALSGRSGVTLKRAMLVGAMSGAGFFLAEKAFLLAGLVGLFRIEAGSAVFGVTGSFLSASWWPILLLGPLVLHVITATCTGIGARAGGRSFLATFLAAVTLHTVYNFMIVTLVGGGGF